MTVNSIVVGLPLLSVIESVVSIPEGVGAVEAPIVGVMTCPLEIIGEAIVLGTRPLPPTAFAPSGAAAGMFEATWVGDKVDALVLAELEPEVIAATDAALARMSPAEVGWAGDPRLSAGELTDKGGAPGVCAISNSGLPEVG